MQKKVIIYISGSISFLILVWNYFGNYRLCDTIFFAGSAGKCPQLLTGIGFNLFPFLPLFLMACIAYFLREETFRAWLKFAYVWIPLTMLAIFMAPEYGHPFLPITKGSIAGVSSLLFVFISLSIIIFKSFSKKHIK